MAAMRAGSPAAAGIHLARPFPASRRTGSPNTMSVTPGWTGVASGSSAIRSAIQPARSRAKAAASGSLRGDGAVATISLRVRSSLSDTRRARRFTRKVTAAPATSSRSPSAQFFPGKITIACRLEKLANDRETGRRDSSPPNLGGFSPFGESDVGRSAGERHLGVPDHAADPRIDLVAEPGAVEDAVVADARLHIVLLQLCGQAAAQVVGGLGLANAGNV